jgi:hypothetical protein
MDHLSGPETPAQLTEEHGEALALLGLADKQK